MTQLSESIILENLNTTYSTWKFNIIMYILVALFIIALGIFIIIKLDHKSEKIFGGIFAIVGILVGFRGITCIEECNAMKYSIENKYWIIEEDIVKDTYSTSNKDYKIYLTNNN